MRHAFLGYQGKGMMTTRAARGWKYHLGEELMARKLRLLPYLLDCSMNGNYPSNVNQGESEVLNALDKQRPPGA